MLCMFLCLVCLCRIRLSEGFHFAASGEGIVNMVMELPMAVKTPKVHHRNSFFFLQFAIFPICLRCTSVDLSIVSQLYLTVKDLQSLCTFVHVSHCVSLIWPVV